MATIGDPLADVGYLCMMWTEPVGPGKRACASTSGEVTRAEGFPTRAELIARYEERSGRSMRDIRWYTTLALWKSIVFMEGNYKRALAGTTDDPYLKTVRRRGARAGPPGGGGRTWHSRSLRTVRRRTGRPRRARHRRQRSSLPLQGLLIDWGGVLTTNLFASFHAYCVRAGIEPAKLVGRFKSDPEARELLIELETGKLPEDEFERRFAALLDVAPEGLIDGLFSGVHARRADGGRGPPGPPGGHPHGAGVELLGRAPLPPLDVRGALRRRRDLRPKRGSASPPSACTSSAPSGPACPRRSACTWTTCPST